MHEATTKQEASLLPALPCFGVSEEKKNALEKLTFKCLLPLSTSAGRNRERLKQLLRYSLKAIVTRVIVRKKMLEKYTLLPGLFFGQHISKMESGRMFQICWMSCLTARKSPPEKAGGREREKILPKKGVGKRATSSSAFLSPFSLSLSPSSGRRCQ